jgi:hypothetical protein
VADRAEQAQDEPIDHVVGLALEEMRLEQRLAR